MANADVAFGLRPVRYMSGAPYNGAAETFFIPATDSTAVYVGGLVKLAGTTHTDGTPIVTGNVASADTVIGVVVAVDAETADSLPYRAASTARYVMVATDPNLCFWVQEDSAGGNMAAPSGATATLTGFTSGSTAYGRSSIEIDSSGLSETADTDDDVLIMGLAKTPDNEIGNNAVWEVRLNNHAYVDAATGV